ncbi:MAG: Oxygen-insensitive NAD(P)H nitroreductase [Candidatus Ozemobacter sibiricus]|jgi:nitroreductase|uniref:Oxygen-insensitive NAD(P)H nitroreductase n=1 Tax=Candidatus Ozemobacter sibiricus TaxID=2268124 RepID=A0A367ZKY3_9BACT|nr:MAG: Oxygen-insensitive NAD(P)H nitroreductase [Candidatus Ozemobacter sibiricus]
MKVVEAICGRRSVKHFDPNHRLSQEEVTRLLSTVILSPTAFNIQNWRFVVVQDPALRQEIRKVAWNQAQVTDASLLVILCADLRAWEKDPARYWRNAEQPVRDFLLPAIKAYYDGKPDVQRDEAMRSCGLAGMALMLAAKEMGYDSCPMDGFDYAAVGRLINLPPDHIISFMVAIGKGIKPAWPRGGQLPLTEVMITDRF